MAARFTGWHHKQGLAEASPDDHARAKLILGQLDEQLRLGGIASGSRTVVLPSGAVVTAAVAMGIPSLSIVSPGDTSTSTPLRVVERAFLGGINGANGHVIVVDLAEYEISNSGVRRTRTVLEKTHEASFGKDIYVIAAGRVDVEAEKPKFPKYYFVHDSPAGGGINQVWKVRASDNKIVATRILPPEFGNPYGAEVNLAAEQLVIGYSEATAILSTEDLTTLGTTGFFTYDTGERVPHPSGRFYILSAANGGITPWLWVIDAVTFAATPIFDLVALGGPNSLGWSYGILDISRDGKTLYVYADQALTGSTLPNQTRGCVLGTVSIEVAPGAPLKVVCSVAQPFVRVADAAGANLVTVSTSEKQVVFGVWASGSGQWVQRSPANPIERIDFPRHRVAWGTRPYISLDDRHMYRTSYLNPGGGDQKLTVSTLERLDVDEHKIDLPTSIHGPVQSMTVALFEIEPARTA